MKNILINFGKWSTTVVVNINLRVFLYLFIFSSLTWVQHAVLADYTTVKISLMSKNNLLKTFVSLIPNEKAWY